MDFLFKKRALSYILSDIVMKRQFIPQKREREREKISQDWD